MNSVDNNRCSSSAREPWSVDRWGRLLAGSGILVFTTLGMLQNPAWFTGTVLASLNLLVTSFTNRCIFHDLIIWLGAKEREDLFFPGGVPRAAQGYDETGPE